MSYKSWTPEIHMTVGTTPVITEGSARVNPFNMAHDLRLLKSAILYADKVKMCSITLSYALNIAKLATKHGLESVRILDAVAEQVSEKALTPIEAVDLLYDLVEAPANELRHGQASSDQLVRARAFKKSITSFIKEHYDSRQSKDLAFAKKSGMVDFYVMSKGDNSKQTQEFAQLIGNAAVSGDTFPVFDDAAGNLVRLGIAAGAFKPTQVAVEKAKQAALSTGLLDQLPAIGDLPMDEVFDIRKEMRNPLIRLRKAIASFSHEIEHTPWEEGFAYDMERFYHETVAPAIAEIEDTYKSSPILSKVFTNIAGQTTLAAGSTLGILLAKAAQLPEIVGLAAGVAVGGLMLAQELRERQLLAERNQLYFIYRLSKRNS